MSSGYLVLCSCSGCVGKFYKLMYEHHCIERRCIYMQVRLLVASANSDVLWDMRVCIESMAHVGMSHSPRTGSAAGLESALTSHWLRTHRALTKRAHVARCPPGPKPGKTASNQDLKPGPMRSTIKYLQYLLYTTPLRTAAPTST